MGGFLSGKLLEVACTSGEDTPSESSCRKTSQERLCLTKIGGHHCGRHRDLPQRSPSKNGSSPNRARLQTNGSTEANHSSSGAPSPSAHVERGGAKKTPSSQSLLGSRIPSGGEGPLSASLRYLVRARPH